MAGIVSSIKPVTLNPVNVMRAVKNDILRQNLRIGEDVLKELRSEIGYPRSNTLALQIKYNRNINYYALAIQNILDKEITESRQAIEKLWKIPKYRKNAQILSENVQRLNVANCGELSELIHQKLIERKINAVLIGWKNVNPDWHRDVHDHGFVVFGFDNKSNLVKEPAHWGENAVVIDGWLDYTGKAIDWEKRLNDFLNLKSYEKMKIDMMRYNPFEI